ncbi:MAG: acetyl-CoA hydrolase, partial [Syntrophomonadaceae bacterium]|nr:acetyl-CoA hydrolase [Syntrophomonadaceae bacterium]
MGILSWQEEYRRKTVSIEEAVKSIKSGDTVAMALGIGACSAAVYNAIYDRHQELERVKFIDTVQLRPNKLYDPDLMAPLQGRIDFTPAF